MRRRRTLLLSLGLALAAGPAAAQQDTTTRAGQAPAATHVLRTRDGSTVVGRVVSDSGGVLVFQTEGGTLTVARSDVIELKPIEHRAAGNGRWLFDDPNRTRLFFAPTGRMLAPGEGYYSNTYLVFQNFAAGASSHLTLGGGFSLLPTGDMSEQVYYFTPEVGVYNTARNNVALGGIMAWVPTDDGKPFGVVYAVATHGASDGSITGGLGYGFYGSDFSSRPVAVLGGARRVSQRLALLTENYGMIYNDDYTECPSGGVCTTVSHRRLGVLSMYGVRFLGEKLSVDLALANLATHDTHWIFPGVPYVAFAVKF